MDALLGLIAFILLIASAAGHMWLAGGLLMPQKFAPGGTRRGVLKRPLALAVAPVFVMLLVGGVAANLEDESASPAAESAKADDTDADTPDPQAEAEKALRESLGWGSTTKEIVEVRTLPQVDDKMLARIDARLGDMWDSADAVRLWGTAIKEVAAGAGDPALEFYDRVVFFMQAETQGGGLGLTAKLYVPTARLQRLTDGGEKPYQQYVEAVGEAQLEPMGRRSASAWCQKNGSDTPEFCRVASR